LTVDIHSLAGLATLFGDVASGRHLNSVELVGARTIEGESPQQDQHLPTLAATHS
jgi:hypothetical protein